MEMLSSKMSFYLPGSDYTDYELFALQTRITPLVRELVKESSAMVHFDLYQDHRIKIRILSKYGSYTNNDLPNMERIVSLVSEHADRNYLRFHQALLYNTAASQLEGIPDTWVSTILPIIPVDDTLAIDYHIDEKMNGNYYINLRKVEDYDRIYQTMLGEMISQLKRLHQEGVCLLPNSMAEPWELRKVADSTPGFAYYRPTWTDTRLTTNPVHFLNKQAIDMGYIHVCIPDLYNHAKRFFVTSKLRYHGFTVRFDGLQAVVSWVEDVQTARQLASYIRSASNRPGKVVYLRFSDEHAAKTAVEVMDKLLPLFEDRPTWYSDEENQKPYVAVGLIDEDQDPEIVKESIREFL